MFTFIASMYCKKTPDHAILRSFPCERETKMWKCGFNAKKEKKQHPLLFLISQQSRKKNNTKICLLFINTFSLSFLRLLRVLRYGEVFSQNSEFVAPKFFALASHRTLSTAAWGDSCRSCPLAQWVYPLVQEREWNASKGEEDLVGLARRSRDGAHAHAQADTDNVGA